jgi:hypothetical protein
MEGEVMMSYTLHRKFKEKNDSSVHLSFGIKDIDTEHRKLYLVSRSNAYQHLVSDRGALG